MEIGFGQTKTNSHLGILTTIETAYKSGVKANKVIQIDQTTYFQSSILLKGYKATLKPANSL